MKSSPIGAELRDSISELAARLDADSGQLRSQRRPRVPGPSRRTRRRGLLAAAAAVTVAAGVGVALTTVTTPGTTDPAASVASTRGTPSTAQPAGRASTYITSFEDLIETADVVAVVTVVADETTDREVTPGEVSSERVITADVEEVLAGDPPPSPIQVAVAPKRHQGGADVLSSEVRVGDRFVVVLASQPNGQFELNGSAGYFPLDMPYRAADLASARAASLDPGIRAIGRATESVHDEDLIALIETVP